MIRVTVAFSRMMSRSLTATLRRPAVAALRPSAPLLGVAAGLLVALPASVSAQRATPRAAATTDTVSRRTLSTAMYGDNAVVINQRPDGRVEIAAAGATHRVSVVVAPRALLAWADSTARMIARRVAPPKKPATTRTIRSFLDEPGLASGGLSLTRRVHASSSSYSVFFADSLFGGFSIPLSRDDAGVFVGAARRAAVAVRDANTAGKPKPKAARKPRARQPVTSKP